MHGYPGHLWRERASKTDLRRADQASEILFTKALQFLRKVIRIYPIIFKIFDRLIVGGDVA